MARIRNMLHWLTVALLALGIAGAPMHAAARAVEAPAGPRVHHGPDNRAAPMVQHQDHESPTKSHPVEQGRGCCHPGCIMALVPGFASLATALLPWVPIPILRDPWGYPNAPFAIDRPPKHA